MVRSLGLLLLLLCAAAVWGADVDFQNDVRPVLAKRCHSCHSAKLTMGGLNLDNKASATHPGDAGAIAVVPGDPSASEMLRRIRSEDARKRMPMGQPALPPEEVAVIERWIQQGANWPEQASTAVVNNWEERKQHWAFQPLTVAAPPEVQNKAWVRNPIDAFIAAAQEKKNLRPSSQASKLTLMRRLTFDLTGLPPKPAEVDEFLADQSPDAVSKLIGRLLENPAYGERWGRHWLDVIRYADSEGYENDREWPTMYHYRDFVIRALNQDMPFDQFVKWQLAGDELAPDTDDALLATGMLTAGPRIQIHATDTAENKERFMYDELDDMVRTATAGMLALTVGCARCHDHKYDAFTAKEYYRMGAIFRNKEREEKPVSIAHLAYDRWITHKREAWREATMEELGVPSDDRPLLRGEIRRDNAAQMAVVGVWNDKLQISDEDLAAALSEQEQSRYTALKQDVADAEARMGGKPKPGMVFIDQWGEPEPSFLLGRGEVTMKKEPVEFGFIDVLTRGKTPEQYREEVAKPNVDTTFRRAALAGWITDTQHGAGQLLARVIVNRMWLHHFGHGLVRSVDDFGRQGDAPTHPELLDWLAGELIRNGWKLKPIHRIMLSSATYQQAREFDEVRAAVDPDNKLLWTRNMLRLEAEIVRDSVLAAAGSLDHTMYGPAVKPPIPREAQSTRSKVPYPRNVMDGPEVWRRSVYVFLKRSVRLPMFETFDTPDPNVTCGRRIDTTLPTQALTLMNEPFVRNQAKLFASAVAERAGENPDDRIRSAFRTALARYPSEVEMASAREFLAGGAANESLVDLCHLLFTLNEFSYVN